MTTCAQNKLLEYYITSWAQEFIILDSDCSTFNSDLKKIIVMNLLEVIWKILHYRFCCMSLEYHCWPI